MKEVLHAHSDRRSAMTLLEVIVSLVLSAVLLTALASVTKVLALQHKLVANMDDSAWLRRLEDRVREDVLHARRYEVGPNRVSLRGRLGRSQDGRRNLKQATVTYRLADRGRALVRIEQQETNRVVRSELLGVGVNMVRVGTPDDRLQDLLNMEVARRGWYDLPDEVRIVLARNSGSRSNPRPSVLVDASIAKPRVTGNGAGR